MEWIDRNTGKVHNVEVFAAILGYSKYSYLEAVASQKVGDFLMVLTRFIHYLGGVPAAIVPANLKSAVIRTYRYEPEASSHPHAVIRLAPWDIEQCISTRKSFS